MEVVLFILFGILSIYLSCVHMQFNSKIALLQERLNKYEDIGSKQLLEEKFNLEINEIKSNLSKDITTLKHDIDNEMNTYSKEFNSTLKSNFKDACEKIKFEEIEYKRTITKKRKEANRKRSKEAKPERIWRYLDEE